MICVFFFSLYFSLVSKAFTVTRKWMELEKKRKESDLQTHCSVPPGFYFYLVIMCLSPQWKRAPLGLSESTPSTTDHCGPSLKARCTSWLTAPTSRALVRAQCHLGKDVRSPWFGAQGTEPVAPVCNLLGGYGAPRAESCKDGRWIRVRFGIQHREFEELEPGIGQCFKRNTIIRWRKMLGPDRKVL